ncbi:hypothetical protein [Fischerella thermalis]|uniref:hypothetical protein n=1 Tax=Fischerella thermalis TaxID=372787 RepID=UPI00307CF570
MGIGQEIFPISNYPLPITSLGESISIQANMILVDSCLLVGNSHQQQTTNH